MTDAVDSDPGQTRCVACREPIHAEARICPQCRSPQAPRRWQAVGATLRWVGGITAVISLVFATVQLKDLVSNRLERSEAVKELVGAAEIQMETRDYEGGWQLLEQALELEPGSRDARDFQVPLAMAWLRRLWLSGGEDRAEVVDRLLPSLYRGVNSPRTTSVADVRAHIGWANNLKLFDGQRHGEIETHYARALELDPGNVYAHVFWGIWVLNQRNQRDYAESKLDKARRHFAAAFDSGEERDYLVKVMLWALVDSHVEGARLESIRFANTFRKADVAVSAGLKKLVVKRAYEYMSPQPGDVEHSEKSLRRLTAIIPPDDLLQTFLWVVKDTPPKIGGVRAADQPKYRYITARLTEAAGDKAKALSLYTSLRADPKSYRYGDRLAAAAIERLGAGGKIE